MLTLPKIIERDAQPYVAIRTTTTMAGIPDVAPRLFGEIWDWVGAKNVAHAESGAILKYNVIDMERELELEFAVPTRKPEDGDERVLSGTLPAGRYASVLWRGGYDALYDVNTVLIGWVRERSITWDVEETPAGDRFGCRMEIYYSDPASVPDPADWETEVAIRIADG